MKGIIFLPATHGYFAPMTYFPIVKPKKDSTLVGAWSMTQDGIIRVEEAGAYQQGQNLRIQQKIKKE